MRTYFDTDSLKVGMMVVYDCSAGLNSCGVTYYLTKVTKTYVEGYSIIGDKRGDIKKITKPKLIRCFPESDEEEEEWNPDGIKIKDDDSGLCNVCNKWQPICKFQEGDIIKQPCKECFPSNQLCRHCE